MCPYLILHPNGVTDIFRFVKSAFVHFDSYHLYYNISSLLWKGCFLEVSMGTKKFLVMTLFPDTYFGYTIGFSCVLFGYKVVSHYYHVNPPSMSSLFSSCNLGLDFLHRPRLSRGSSSSICPCSRMFPSWDISAACSPDTCTFSCSYSSVL